MLVCLLQNRRTSSCPSEPTTINHLILLPQTSTPRSCSGERERESERERTTLYPYSQLVKHITNMERPCPFCGLLFKRLGNHLQYCKQREGRDYTHLLSTKTMSKYNKASKSRCPKCLKFFKRLDTHLQKSAKCKHLGPADKSTQPSLPQLTNQHSGRVEPAKHPMTPQPDPSLTITSSSTPTSSNTTNHLQFNNQDLL